MSYIELQALTAFSFQEGASLPEEIANRAAELNHTAIATADRNSLSGIVRAHVTAKKLGLRFIVGTRLDLADGQSFVAYPKNRSAYGRLCRLITLGRRRAEKGRCEIYPAGSAGVCKRHSLNSTSRFKHFTQLYPRFTGLESSTWRPGLFSCFPATWGKRY